MKTKLKRILLLLAWGVLLTVLLCFNVSAAEITGKCGDNMTYTFNSESGEMVISGSGKMWDFRNDADFFDYHKKPWEKIKLDIKNVVFEDGVEYIGADAFAWCENLKSVKFSDTITYIGSFSFWGCTSLENPILPAKLQCLGQQAFDHCEKITRIVIPDTISFLDAGIFTSCTSLKYAYIGGSKETGGFVHSDCLFRFCDSLERIEVSPDNIALCEVDGVLYDKNMTTLEQYPAGRKDKSYSILPTVESIRQFAVEGNPYIEEFILPQSLDVIGVSGISDCHNLKRLCYIGTKEEWEKITVCEYNDQLEDIEKIFLWACYVDGIVKHTEKTVVGKPATYTEIGLTDGKKCSVCGIVFVEQKEIARKKLGEVTGLKVKSATASEIKLSWKKVAGAEKYNVYYSTDGKKWKKTTTEKNAVTVKKLKSGTKYRFKVKAVTGKYAGKYSSILNTATKVSSPVIKSLKSAKAKTATLVWTPVSGANGYQVKYSTSKKFTKKTTKSVTVKKQKAKKVTLKKLKKGKKYYVKLRAFKTVNGKKIYGSYSKVKSVKIK